MIQLEQRFSAMRRFWQFISMPPRQWLVKFGLLFGLFLVLLLVGGRQLPTREMPLEKVVHCGEQNQWLALVDQYLGTQLVSAQSGGPCVKLSAQCQGPYDAYPGFKLEWFGFDTLPSWKYQVVIPGFEFVRTVDGQIQAASAGFKRWDTDPSVPALSAGSGLVTQLVRTETATGLAIDDDTYYRAAVYSQNTTKVQCAGTTDIANNTAPDCLRFRTRDLPPDPRYGVPVTSATCPWQAEETTPELSIPCGETILYTSPLSSNRGGTTEWEISGITLVSASPSLTANTSQPPLVYEGTFSDGSTARLSMEGNRVVASRTSLPGGVCNPPPPELTCALRINSALDATWQSSSAPAPTLTWTTGNFANGDDTLEAKEYTASDVPTGKAASTNLATGSTGLGALPRVRPGESPTTLKYIGTVTDTGVANGSVRSQAGSCQATLTITAESPPSTPGGGTCVGGCSPTPSCNSVEVTWSPVANAKTYRVRTYRSDGTLLRTDDVSHPTTRLFIPVAPSASYSFRLQTIDQLDNASALSPPFTATLACTAGPDPPPALSLTPGPTCTQMSLGWTDSANETSYEVYRGPSSSGPWTLITSPALAANTTSYTDSGLTQLTSYSYHVDAVNSNGRTISNIATASTTACPGGADFTVSVSPASRTISPGGSTTYTATITSTSLPNTPITPSVTGLPSGASAIFAPNPVTTPPADGSVTSTMTVSTTGATPLGTSSLTVSGTGASLTRSAGTTLIVATANNPPSPPGGGGPPTPGLMCSTPPLLSFSFTYTDPDSDPASQFSFQVDNDADFSSPIVDRPNQPSSVASGGTITQLVEVRQGGGAGVLDYNRPYYWRARVWDNKGAASSWMSAVSFTSPNHAHPQPDFTASATTITPGSPIDFIDQSIIASGFSIAKWIWNFGSDVTSATVTTPPGQPADQDGSSTNNTVTQSPPPNRSQPHVTYSATGAKTVTLTVQDSGGPAFTCSRTKVLFGGSGTNLNWREIKAQ